MGNLWLRIRIWSKALLVTVLVLYVILFVYKNAQKKVEFWYWFHRGPEPEINLLLLVLCTFLAGIVGAVLVRTTFRTVRQVQDLKDRTRAQRQDRDIAEMKTKASM